MNDLSIVIGVLDELIRMLEEMKEDLSLKGLSRWVSKIENEVRKTAGSEYKEQIDFKVIEMDFKNFDITFSVPREISPLVENSIKRNLKEMPITTRPIFKHLLMKMKERRELAGNKVKDIKGRLTQTN